MCKNRVWMCFVSVSVLGGCVCVRRVCVGESDVDVCMMWAGVGFIYLLVVCVIYLGESMGV